MPDLLHSHPDHRSRQLRWVLPIVLLLTVGVIGVLATFYSLGDQDVGTEFFHAHKTIAHTGQLLQRGILVGLAILLVFVVLIALRLFVVTHRIVRPVHTLHRTLDELASGNLGVRLELHERDEFKEVAQSLNRLIDEFAETLRKVHAQVDEIDQLAEAGTDPVRLRAVARRLNETVDFFRLEPSQIIKEENP